MSLGTKKKKKKSCLIQPMYLTRKASAPPPTYLSKVPQLHLDQNDDSEPRSNCDLAYEIYISHMVSDG